MPLFTPSLFFFLTATVSTHRRRLFFLFHTKGRMALFLDRMWDSSIIGFEEPAALQECCMASFRSRTNRLVQRRLVFLLTHL